LGCYIQGFCFDGRRSTFEGPLTVAPSRLPSAVSSLTVRMNQQLFGEQFDLRVAEHMHGAFYQYGVLECVLYILALEYRELLEYIEVILFTSLRKRHNLNLLLIRLKNT